MLLTCMKNFGDPMDQLRKCNSCPNQFYVKCLKMPTAVYDYLSKTKGVWFCHKCTVEVNSLMKGVTASKPSDAISKLKTEFDKTVDSVKNLMEDLNQLLSDF